LENGTMNANPHQAAARVRKAAAIAQLLLEHGFTPADLAGFGPDQWRLAAQAAQVNPPSATTQGLVVTMLSAAA
jgi:hypothetical protein